ncbi:M4 family peptidase [Pseudonocardiaceae bacterium YIM PH 21723]|nr:M4 family peptidase [Pseudonocardiaceae bacterium YIM PH 21723]
MSNIRIPLLAAAAAVAVVAPLTYGSDLSIGSVSNDLRVVNTAHLPGGDVVRLQQYIDGVKVFGGDVTRTQVNGKTVELGHTTKRGIGSFPAPKTDQVRSAAAKAVQKAEPKASQIKASKVESIWFDPTLWDMSGDNTAVPAYLVQVGGRESATEQGAWAAVVRASDNQTLAQWETHNDALSRTICDANSQAFDTSYGQPSDWQCGTAVRETRKEGQAATGVADVDKIYDYFGNTSALYAKVNWDLTDHIGLNGALRATVRGCDTQQCPYTNAFWDGQQMFFGDGLSTDDITGHELTHGVTQATNGLQYLNESGAINESMSDIMGMFVHIGNSSANRWKLGAGSSIGVIRDMQTPENYRQPSSYKGANWYSGSSDNGGVHTNSGVGNKADFLITDGGTFGGQTIKGLGVDKSFQIWWRVENTLTSSSNYAALGKALNTSCTALVGTAGITTADCAEVAKVVKATKIG